MPDKVALMIELAKRQMAQEMPEELKRATIRPMSDGGSNRSLAETNLENRIEYNPVRLQQFDQNDISDILAHELVHVRQNKEDPPSIGGLLRFLADPILGRSIPYAQDPYELEGWKVMKDRALKQHRSMGVLQPSFDGGPQRIGDINLPKDNK